MPRIKGLRHFKDRVLTSGIQREAAANDAYLHGGDEPSDDDQNHDDDDEISSLPLLENAPTTRGPILLIEGVPAPFITLGRGSCRGFLHV